MQGTLHQLRTSYDPIQDRVLLCASTSDGNEFRFWITRRFIKLLWRAMGHIADKFAERKAPANPLIRSALTELAQDKAMQEADFETRYEGGRQMPLGEAPILLARIEVKPDPSGRQILRLLPEQGQGIDLGLDESLAHVLASLLRQAATAGEWELTLDELAPPPPQPAAGQRQLH